MSKSPPKSKSVNPQKLELIPLNQQLILFGNRWGQTDDLSNTIELWDAMPKYAFTARRQSTARDERGRLTVHTQDFTYAKRACRVEIQPASIKLENGVYRDFYPSSDEELVEEVLRKIFADQQYGRHDVDETESWVKFSLQMIRKELKKRNKTRSIQEIKQSIEILAKTHISFYVEDDTTPLYMNTILGDLVRVSREKYLNDGTAMWWAKLPALISKSINEISYRQFNYAKLMCMKSQLSRWLHKRLSHNYINAHYLSPYEILFSSIQRDSGFLTYTRTNDNVAALEAALSELKENAILMKWEKQERRGNRNKLNDILYTFIPAPEFVGEIKTANARQKDIKEKLIGDNNRSGR